MRLLIFASILMVSACQAPQVKLFWVDQDTDTQNDLLFLAESTNVKTLDAEEAKKLLLPNEIIEFQTGLSTFKKFEQIYQSPAFTVLVILKNGNDSLGRDYSFNLRTFRPSGKIIDSYELACWIKQKERFCFGYIDDKLKIEKSCRSDQQIDRQQINDSGFFENY